MTRLKEGDLIPIPARLPEYDDRLRGIVGVSLAEIACKAAGVDEKPLGSGSIMARFAAVPMNSGFGVIQGFSAAASAVVSHLGFEAFVTEDSDVAGIVEGIGAGADVLLLADDERYVAMVPEIGFYVDNSPATALGFVTALEIMNGGLVGESVLVLGCGPLGVAASKALIERGAEVGLCDVVEARAQAASRG
ncbi:MAG: 3-methylornithyl-N6-L-lysine dehydrogenase PylD, partial [Gemmatimonadetes bacterium]|nr:3-methylornithyl-N6-L-lysine dehydrogenase PylD [Gemmatimonadota bacterium]